MYKKETNRGKSNLLFPIIIIILGILISVGIFVFRNDNQKPQTETAQEEQKGLKPINENDKILGNPNADILIVVYTDFECPFCKEFHQTMRDIMIEYGRIGKVAWVYRHFPIEANHKNAKFAAIASECVFKIGGNEKFWNYADVLFSSETEILSSDNLTKIANEIGINNEEFLSCTQNSNIISKIEDDIKEGMLIYKKDPDFGTPYTFILTKTGIQTELVGAKNYIQMKTLIDRII